MQARIASVAPVRAAEQQRLAAREEPVPTRFRTFVIAVAALFATAAPAPAQELVYGSWLPAREYMTANVMPGVLDQIAKDTNWQIKWKLVPGGQLADGRATFAAVQDNLMQAGIGIPTYVPSVVPSVFVLYSSVLFGDDVVAGSGAALETLTLHCPTCIEDAKKINAVPLAGWVAAPYHLLCREPVQTVADIKGKRVRATGGGAEMLRSAGAVTIAGTLTEAVSLLQRGGLDCVFGSFDWLRTFAYADFTKYVNDYPLGMTGPAIGFLLNRDTWNKFTPEQRQAHLRAAAKLTAETAIGGFIVSNQAALADAIKDKGVTLVKASPDFAKLASDYKKAERDRLVTEGQKLGVKDPGAIVDAYEKAFEKWQALSKDIGRDPKKFADAIMREIYSKVDPGNL